MAGTTYRIFQSRYKTHKLYLDIPFSKREQDEIHGPARKSGEGFFVLFGNDLKYDVNSDLRLQTDVERKDIFERIQKHPSFGTLITFYDPKTEVVTTTQGEIDRRVSAEAERQMKEARLAKV